MVLSGLLQAPHASAEERSSPSAAPEQQLQALEQKAQEAQQANDTERARGFWLQAFSLQATASTALSLGKAELELKRYRDSAEHLDYALRMLPDTASEQTRTAAKKALAEAKAQIAVIQATTNRPGAEVRVDGKTVGKAPLQSSIYLDPGTHDISAHWENNSITRPVAVLAGQEYQLTLPLIISRATPSNQKHATPVARRAPEPTPVMTSSESFPDPIPLLVGGTTFVAGLASGIVFRLDSDAQYRNAEAMRSKRASTGCLGELSQSEECVALRAAAEAGDRSRNWSTVGFAVAGTALVGTLVYLYWPWRGEKPKRAALLQLTPLVSHTAPGLSLYGEY
jgi:tetratricopeptide (TPR) repeat protein